MRAAEHASEGSVEDLKIRLEGAFEAIEAAANRYDEIKQTLEKSRWRRALRDDPYLLEEAAQKEGPLRDARAKCERLAESPDAPAALHRALSRLQQTRAAAHKLTLKRLRARVEIPFEDALHQLAARVLAEIPGNLRHGEKRLLEGGAMNQLWAIWFSVFTLVGTMSGPIAELFGANDGKGIGALAVLGILFALFWVPFIHSFLLSGRYTLTNQRLIWTPRRGEPVQVELATLKPGAFQLSGWGSIKVDALEPFKMRGLENAAQLAAYAEMMRWMAAIKVQSEPLTDVAIFPAFEGEEGYFTEDATAPNVVAVMRPHYAAYFYKAKAGVVLKAITGNTPGAEVDLPSVMRLLCQLGPEQFDQIVRAAAEKEGVLMDRPPARVVSTGPVWQHLIVRSPSHAFAAKVTWRYIQEVEPMVAKWRQS